jgi:hypothetical protein
VSGKKRDRPHAINLGQRRRADPAILIARALGRPSARLAGPPSANAPEMLALRRAPIRSQTGAGCGQPCRAIWPNPLAAQDDEQDDDTTMTGRRKDLRVWRVDLIKRLVTIRDWQGRGMPPLVDASADSAGITSPSSASACASRWTGSEIA